MPYVNGIFNLFTGKRLKIPEGAQIAISNRGGYNGYWKDSMGTEHPNYISVTTLYALSKSEGGDRILFADPWLPFGFSLKSFPFIRDKKIDLPKGFITESFCASASTLFVSGKDEGGNFTLMARLADFDTEKINRFLPYGDEENIKSIENKNEIDDNLRVMPKDYNDIPPDKLWIRISLEGLDEQDADFNSLTIFQTGLGNDAREMRIGSSAFNGFYRKLLIQKDDPWEFQAVELGFKSLEGDK